MMKILNPMQEKFARSAAFIKRMVLFSCLLLGAQVALAQQTVTGTVTDVDGLPLPGVSVVEKSTTNGVSTDFDGNYSITVEGTNSILVFSYLGSKTQSITVGSQSTITISLEEDYAQLDEVVLIGYGQQDQEKVTTAIATVKADDFNPGFVRDAADLVKGKVAGLNITNGSGDPTAGAFISLRGVSSLAGGTAPLVLINNMPGGLNDVAPEDIESVTVLKDASAAAIYGTRAANGVILITTKSGSDRKGTLSYSHYTSMSSFVRTADFLDAADLRRLIAEGEDVPNIGGDLGSTTDWLGEISRTALTQNHNLSYTGGSKNSNYAVNVNYVNQEGVFKGSENEEFRLSANLDHIMFDGILKLNVNLINGFQRTGALGNGGTFDNRIYRQALIRNPTDAIRNEDGSFVQREGVIQYVNPVGMIELLEGEILNNWARLTGNITLTPIEGWENNLMVSTTRRNSLAGFYEKKEYLGYNGERFNGRASRNGGIGVLKLMEFTSKYGKTIDKHDFSVLGGYTYQYSMGEGFSASNQDFPTDLFSYNNLGVGRGIRTGDASVGSSKADETLIGFFGRANYSFDNKYNLLVSLRHEGSSKFGENYQWGTFPAVSAGWNIHNEPFMANADFVDNLKLRVGYGETGVIVAGPYQSLTRLAYNRLAFLNGEWIQGLSAITNPNPDLRWEVSKEYNFGLDFGFLNNRISGSLDVYRKTTEDLLFSYAVPVPPNLFGSTLANVGSLQNQGIELLLNVSPVQTDDFSWDANITLSYNENELLSLSNDLYQIEGNFINTGGVSEPVSQGTHRLEVGQPVSSFWGLKSVGVTPHPVNPGVHTWVIELPDGTTAPFDFGMITDDSAKQYLGNGIPDFIGGLTNTFRYKNLDLSFLLSGAFGFEILNAQRLFYENRNLEYNVLDSAYNPVYGEEVVMDLIDGRSVVSHYIEKGDYVKLDNLTLGYNVNVDKLKFLSGLRVYATGTNLAVFTKYSGIDPEIIRTSPLSQGTDDRDKYPIVGTYTLGINVNF